VACEGSFLWGCCLAEHAEYAWIHHTVFAAAADYDDNEDDDDAVVDVAGRVCS